MIMVDAFGTIALVAMMPTISIQLVGLIYKIKLSHSKTAIADDTDILIIEGIGEDTIPTKSTTDEIKLNNTAIADLLEDDDIEIIDFPGEYEYVHHYTSSENNSEQKGKK